MNKKFLPPYLGVAYYPEDWDEIEIDRDIEKMVDMGINVARIGEFAWHKMEPKPMEYNFTWLHNVVDKLGSAGIGVVMGTPTATPPIWLSKMYPDIMAEAENGRIRQHGGRRHCCSNNPHYREYSARIVEKMALDFGNDENIIGWQIDNEIYSWGMGCFCQNCQKRFINHVTVKFKTIENLNKSWNLNLFSQTYGSFYDIPTPRDTWVNPHHKMEWMISQQNAHIDFVQMQADILKKYTTAPIGTDIMAVNGMDYRKLNKKLDVVQFNHYNTAENLWHVAMWFDYIRNFLDTPFWNTETSTCWNGSAVIDQNMKPEGFCYVNSFMPVALGGEANMYWLWRTHWAGHELVHGAVLDSSGRPMYIENEVKKVANDYKKCAGFLNSTKVKTDVAMMFTSLNWNMFSTQNIVQGLKYDDSLKETFYKPIIECGIRPDVIDAYANLSDYKLLFSPLCMTIDEGYFSERISEWVKDGGTWVVGPMTDIRNKNGAKFKNSPFGILEKLTGAKWKYSIPDSFNIIKAKWNNGDEFKGDKWFELYEDLGTSLVNVAEGHSAIKGLSLVSEYDVGKGKVIVLGTLPCSEDMKKIIKIAADNAKVHYCDCDSLLVIPRHSDRIEGLILIEYAGKESKYTLEREMTDIISGEALNGTINVNPYQVLVLK